MNILLVSTSYPLRPESSSGIFVKRLKHSLDKISHVEVVCPDDSITAENECGIHRSRYSLKKWQVLAHQPGGIPAAVRQDYRLFFLVPFLLISMLVSIIRNVRTNDLIFANWAINAVVAWLPSKIFRKPIVTTFRGEDVRNLGRGIQPYIVWLALWASDAIVLVSSDMKKPLENRFPRFKNKLFVIPNGVENNLLGADLAARASSTSTVSILTVASLIPRKDIATLIKAVAYINNTDGKKIDIKLNIVGDGQLRADLEALSVSEGVDSIVKFHGMLSPDNVEALYSESQIFVLSSLYEGRPNVVVEAMAAGLPVIAASGGALQENVEKGVTGTLVPVNNVGALAKAIICTLENSKHTESMARDAKKLVQHKFNWDEAANKMVDLYSFSNGM